MSRPLLFAVVLLVAAAAGGFWYWLRPATDRELRFGGYIEAEQIQIGSRLAGRVRALGQQTRTNSDSVRIDEGAEVEKGQVLVIFETDEVEAQLMEAHANLSQAEAKLAELNAGTREEEIQQAVARVDRLSEKVKMLEAGPREEEVQQARLMYESAKAEFDNAAAEYRRQVALAERSAVAASTLEAARKDMETSQLAMEAEKQKYELLRKGSREEEKKMAWHELAEAQAALQQARNGPRPEEIEQAQATVDAADARIRRLTVLLEEGTVRAPLDCVVETFDLQPGDMIMPGTPFATLVRKDEMWVRAFVPETQLGLILDRGTVTVTVDSFPNQRFTGHIVRINRVAEFTPRNVQTFKERQDMMFPIKVRVDDPEGVLRPGMAATVHMPASLK